MSLSRHLFPLHGRDIGHHTHATGNDVDIYHFLRYPGTASAQNNYDTLVAHVKAALAGDAAALAQVTNWVSAMRTGLANLAALPSVYRLYTSLGNSISTVITQGQTNTTVTLPEGWARSLLQTGAVTASNGYVSQTSLGVWTGSNGKVVYNSVHNNHIHIALQ
jgi:hypothetical protein